MSDGKATAPSATTPVSPAPAPTPTATSPTPAASAPAAVASAPSSAVTAAPNAVIKSGWLVKRGAWMPTWKRRWCVLKGNGTMTYFTNAIDAMDEKDSKGVMDIQSGTVEVLTDADATKRQTARDCGMVGAFQLVGAIAGFGITTAAAFASGKAINDANAAAERTAAPTAAAGSVTPTVASPVSNTPSSAAAATPQSPVPASNDNSAKPAAAATTNISRIASPAGAPPPVPKRPPREATLTRLATPIGSVPVSSMLSPGGGGGGSYAVSLSSSMAMSSPLGSALSSAAASNENDDPFASFTMSNTTTIPAATSESYSASSSSSQLGDTKAPPASTAPTPAVAVVVTPASSTTASTDGGAQVSSGNKSTTASASGDVAPTSAGATDAPTTPSAAATTPPTTATPTVVEAAGAGAGAAADDDDDEEIVLPLLNSSAVIGTATPRPMQTPPSTTRAASGGGASIADPAETEPASGSSSRPHHSRNRASGNLLSTPPAATTAQVVTDAGPAAVTTPSVVVPVVATPLPALSAVQSTITPPTPTPAAAAGGASDPAPASAVAPTLPAVTVVTTSGTLTAPLVILPPTTPTAASTAAAAAASVAPAAVAETPTAAASSGVPPAAATGVPTTPVVSAAPRESILSPKSGPPLIAGAKSPPPLPPAISRASKPTMTGFVLAQHQKAAAVIAAAKAQQTQQPATTATPAAATPTATTATAAGGGGATAATPANTNLGGVELNRKSPLTKLEESTLVQWLPLGSKTTDQLDAFFTFIRTNLPRHKWHYVLESHVVMAASLHKTVATLIYQNWARWLFPLMQRQSEKQLLMDKESEQSLLAMVTLLISTVHFRRFGLDVAVATGPSDRAKLEELASNALSGLQKMMDRAAAAASASDSKSKTPPAASASTPAVAVTVPATPTIVEDDIGTAISALITLIADFCWNDGTVRVVRMILSSFLSLVLKAAQNDRGWRNQVTHPSWKNLLSVLSVLEEYVFCRPLNAKKMGVHLSGRGCLDLRLVNLAKSILDSLPVHTLDSVPDSNPITAKLQKQIQACAIDEIAFWGCTKIYFEKIGALAAVLPTSLVVDAKQQEGMKLAMSELSVAQQSLTQVMASRKRFGSFWTANKVKPEVSELFVDIPNELRQRKNSKFMQPAVQFATLQDATATTIAAKEPTATPGAAAGAAGAGEHIPAIKMSTHHRPSVTPEFDEDDELTQADVDKLLSQCRGDPISNGSFGRVYRVQLFASWWACKILNSDMVSRTAIRSEIRVHRKLRSRRCVMFRGCWTKGNTIVILSEWGGHDLHQFIHPKAKISTALLAEQKTTAATTTPVGLAIVKEQESSSTTTSTTTAPAPQPSDAASATNTATPSPAVSTSASPAPSPHPSIGPLSSSQSANTAGGTPSASGILPSPTGTTTTTPPATTPTPTATAAPAAAAATASPPPLAPSLSLAKPARASTMHHAAPPTQPLTDALRAKISYQIAEGLNELHHQTPPVVHRDLKPSNVLMDKHYDVKLCDFGFSHSVNASSLASSHSDNSNANRKNGKAGTPLYKAPETWDPDLTIDVASDVYSYGIVLHELWSAGGVLPWSDKSYEQLVALHLIKRSPPPIDASISQQHANIAAVIEWCTRPDRKSRPKMEQLMERLQVVLPEYGMEFD